MDATRMRMQTRHHLLTVVRALAPQALTLDNLSALMAVPVMAVCLNNAMIGIITSMFLQRLNSVVKV